jgi:single-stranded-DNA-specific exonuclease
MANWMVAAKKADFTKIAESCHISPVLARLIRNRNVIGAEATERYLNGGLQDLYDPFLMKDMDTAVSILREKTAEGKKIRIIGDYDVDGICSAHILEVGLTAFGADAGCRLPDRVMDGYGINERLIEEAAADGVDTIVTCDNGISAAEPLRRAAALGLTVIVTDHHEIPFRENSGTREEILPEAAAVLEPKRTDPASGNYYYPFQELCGAGVAWKLVCALFSGRGEEAGELERQLLAFAAIATVCDVCALKEENRIIVKYGLAMAEKTDNAGLKALLSVTGLTGPVTCYHAGFVIGPCLNASGRLDTAERALHLFDGETGGEDVLQAAGELRDLNESRKSMTKQGIDAAVRQIESEGLLQDKVLVVFLENGHESISGIIAGKIREKYDRPAFVFTNSAEEGILKGSGRSIEAYDMFGGMSRCADLLLKFGGHPMAGGLSIRVEKLPEFRERINSGSGLTDADLTAVLHLDMELPPQYLSMDMVREFSRLEPCGAGNERPLFACRGLYLTHVFVMGSKGNAVKFTAEDGKGGKWPVLYFGDTAAMKERLQEIYGESVWEQLTARRDGIHGGTVCADLCYYPDINRWKGSESIQLILRDIRFHRPV